MFSVERDGDTICAPSTPPGVGGISVIRMSGQRAASIARSVAPKFPTSPQSHRAYFSTLRGPGGDLVDECIFVFFEKGHSFTGEETVEISCHGSPVIVSDILNLLIDAGARSADRGEFTYRAYMNGRLDLAQAEGVLSLIESQTSLAARVALRQLRGGLSKDLTFIEDRLTWCLAQIEAGIDFSTEDIEVIDTSQLTQCCREMLVRVERLLASYSAGRVAREGLRVALVGEANVGKSSLLNRLIDEERALVTPIAGTTRDVVEGRMMIAGIPVTILDTAGIRETGDIIESLGIRKTYEALAEADLVLFVYDVREPLPDVTLRQVQQRLKGELWIVGNKSDLVKDIASLEEPDFRARTSGIEVRRVSAHSGEGIQALRDQLGDRFAPAASELSLIFHSRHFELLKKVYECLNRAATAIERLYSPELVAIEFQEALLACFEILGKQVDEQVIDRIFKEFCLGK